LLRIAILAFDLDRIFLGDFVPGGKNFSFNQGENTIERPRHQERPKDRGHLEGGNMADRGPAKLTGTVVNVAAADQAQSLRCDHSMRSTTASRGWVMYCHRAYVLFGWELAPMTRPPESSLTRQKIDY
jgi:hypothetical protein